MTITATQIKQNSALLQEALKEEVIVTRHDKPFVVILGYEKFKEMEKMARKYQEEKQAKSLRSMWLESAKESEKCMAKDDNALFKAMDAQAAETMGYDDA